MTRFAGDIGGDLLAQSSELAARILRQHERSAAEGEDVEAGAMSVLAIRVVVPRSQTG